MRKLGKQPKNASDVSDNSYSYRLVELSSLLKAFQPLHQCEVGGELTMSEDEALMYGNSSVIHIECSKCDTKLDIQTSGNSSESWTPQTAMDVNRRMVYAGSEIEKACLQCVRFSTCLPRVIAVPGIST